MMDIQATLRLALEHLGDIITYTVVITAVLVIGFNLLFGLIPWRMFHRKQRKRVILVLGFLLLGTVAACGQQGNTLTLQFAGVPTGGCAPIMFAVNNANGDLYSCNLGAWVLIGGGSVFGTQTANYIFAAPNGVPGAPTFRLLASADLPALASPIVFPMAACNNVTATPLWDLPTANAATAACKTGTNTQKGVANFTTGQSAQMTYLLPGGLTGAADVRAIWSSAQTASTGTFTMQAVCTPVDGTTTDDPAFGAFWAPAQDTSPGTANWITTTQSFGIAWPATCTANRVLHLRLAWTAGTMTSVNVTAVELTLRATQ